jgi:hypothetical protein
MLKLSSLSKVCIDYLTANLPGVKHEPGKRGELPSLTPCVWIYVEPHRQKQANYKNYPVLRRAKVTFFACEGAAVNKTDAANKSIDLAEKVEQLIFSEDFFNYINAHKDNINTGLTEVTYTDSDQPLNFDDIYSDIAVSYLETWINYAPFWEIE